MRAVPGWPSRSIPLEIRPAPIAKSKPAEQSYPCKFSASQRQLQGSLGEGFRVALTAGLPIELEGERQRDEPFEDGEEGCPYMVVILAGKALAKDCFSKKRQFGAF